MKPSKRKLCNFITVIREDIAGSRQAEIANLTFPGKVCRAKSRIRARNADDGGTEDAMELELAMHYN